MDDDAHLREAARVPSEITGREWFVRPKPPPPDPFRDPDAHLRSAARALERVLNAKRSEYVWVVEVRPRSGR